MTNKQPTHDCPVFGKDAIVPKAYNTARPGEFTYKCPMCNYTVDYWLPLEEMPNE